VRVAFPPLSDMIVGCAPCADPGSDVQNLFFAGRIASTWPDEGPRKLNSVRLSRWVVNQCFDEVSDLIDWEADHFLRAAQDRSRSISTQESATESAIPPIARRSPACSAACITAAFHGRRPVANRPTGKSVSAARLRD
jgi:hypothetical protein